MSSRSDIVRTARHPCSGCQTLGLHTRAHTGPATAAPSSRDSMVSLPSKMQRCAARAQKPQLSRAAQARSKKAIVQDLARLQALASQHTAAFCWEEKPCCPCWKVRPLLAPCVRECGVLVFGSHCMDALQCGQCHYGLTCLAPSDVFKPGLAHGEQIIAVSGPTPLQIVDVSGRIPPVGGNCCRQQLAVLANSMTMTKLLLPHEACKCRHSSFSTSRTTRRLFTKQCTCLLQSIFRKPQGKSLAYNKSTIDLGPVKVSPLGIGTWAWGNKFLWGYDRSMDADLRQVFDFVTQRGINLFDTADSYGTGVLNGRSEQLLGEFARGCSQCDEQRSNICIATKLAPYPWRITSAQFVAACRGSLKRLGMEQIGIGQLHWSTANYQPLQERALWDGLARMHDEGLVQAVGVSNYGAKQLQKIAAYLKKRNVPLVTAQVQFSLVSCGPEQMAVKAACDDLGIQLISYSPLGLGMLSGRYSTAAGIFPTGPRGVLFRQILPGIQPLLDEMQAVAAAKNKTMSQVALNWCLAKGTIPIPGAKDVKQAEEALGALGWGLSSGELSEIEAAANRAPKKMLQNIFQTE